MSADDAVLDVSTSTTASDDLGHGTEPCSRRHENRDVDTLVDHIVEVVSAAAHRHFDTPDYGVGLDDDPPLRYTELFVEQLTFEQLQAVHDGVQSNTGGRRVKLMLYRINPASVKRHALLVASEANVVRGANAEGFGVAVAQRYDDVDNIFDIEPDALAPAQYRLEVSVLASGFAHSAGVTEAVYAFAHAVKNNQFAALACVNSHALMQLGPHRGAPDIVVHGIIPRGPLFPGQPGRPITFVGEVERDNRSLPAFIQHLGDMWVIPSVNGVLGVKFWRRQGRASCRAVLFVLRKAVPGGVPQYLAAFDFGGEAMRPGDLLAADADMHLAFGAAPPQWTRVPNGRNADMRDVVVDIPFEVVVNGVLDAAGSAVSMADELRERQMQWLWYLARLVGAGGWEPLRINLPDLFQRLSMT